MNDNNWELMCLINNYNKALKEVSEFSIAYEQIQEKYLQAIRLQCQEDYGQVMVTEDFIKLVETGSFNDYDGQGTFLSWEGYKKDSLICNVDWLEDYKEEPFVIWYNK